ncbi:hypothetical protein [Leifsonia aquatica]|uniref:hypothetical protein n=1 Tax=Leifsonia aquatica TaxID=144185 RepID=UPI00382ACBE8
MMRIKPKQRVSWKGMTGVIVATNDVHLWPTCYFVADGATEGTWVNEDSLEPEPHDSESAP